MEPTKKKIYRKLVRFIEFVHSHSSCHPSRERTKKRNGGRDPITSERRRTGSDDMGLVRRVEELAAKETRTRDGDTRGGDAAVLAAVFLTFGFS